MKTKLLSMNLVRSSAVPSLLSILLVTLSAGFLPTSFGQQTPPKRHTIRQVQEGARGGDPQMQNELGVRYTKGEDMLERDFVKAAEWFRKAADQGFVEGQHNLAGLYFYGTGLPQDYQEALKWYLKAAEGGFPAAQNFLGWMYLNGPGVSYDFKEAMKWYRRAAEQGDKEGQFNLGVMYFKGEDLNPNYIEAYKWVNLAAAQGHANAIRHRVKLGEALTKEELAEAQRRSSEFKPKKES